MAEVKWLKKRETPMAPALHVLSDPLARAHELLATPGDAPVAGHGGMVCG